MPGSTSANSPTLPGKICGIPSPRLLHLHPTPTSLHLDRAPCVFLHVPPVDRPYSLDELRRLCGLVLEALVAELPRPRVGLAVLLRNRTAHPGCIVVGKRLTKHSDGNSHGLDRYAAPVSRWRQDVVYLATSPLMQGGHLEFGESFEECARREAMEECGVTLQRVTYGTTLNVVDREYHAVVIVMVADVTEVRKGLNATF